MTKMNDKTSASKSSRHSRSWLVRLWRDERGELVEWALFTTVVAVAISLLAGPLKTEAGSILTVVKGKVTTAINGVTGS
jgi:Flp pilus assembly pilin Flp